MSCLLLFCLCVFSNHFSIAITSLGEGRARLGAFRTFVRFALVWFCLFPPPLGVWERLRFAIVALDFSLTHLPILFLFYKVFWRRGQGAQARVSSPTGFQRGGGGASCPVNGVLPLTPTPSRLEKKNI